MHVAVYAVAGLDPETSRASRAHPELRDVLPPTSYFLLPTSYFPDSRPHFLLPT